MSEVSGEPAFDVYARPFHPNFLRRINAANALEVFTATSHDLDIDYGAYIATFAGNTFLSAVSPYNLSFMSEPPYRIAGSLQPENYAAVFHELLRAEINALTAAQQDFAVYNSPLTFLRADLSGTSFFATCCVPGVAE
jgi:hypothetical protein